MTEQKKLKHKAIGQIDYVWNLALFARQFDVEVDAPPKGIAIKLASIEQARHGFFIRRSRTAKLETVDDGETYNFDIRMRQTNRSITYTSVKATGRIIYSQGYDKTIIRGDIRLGWFYSGSLLIALLWSIYLTFGIFFQTTTRFASDFLFFVLFFLYLGYVIWSIKTDYDELTAQIQYKINSAQQSNALNDYYESKTE